MKPILKPADLEERTRLATMLQQSNVDKLGLQAALTLINAPAREITEEYWFYCAKAIIAGRPMPLPPEVAERVVNTAGMSDVETVIACADIYLWLGQRPEFRRSAPQAKQVFESRQEAIKKLDAALLKKMVTGKRCRECDRPLEIGYRFKTCNNCYGGGTRGSRWARTQ
jgi:hypothetical protein